METAAHRHLKDATVSLLLQSGCAAAAAEVRCPIARHRVDVAGFLDPLPKKLQADGDTALQRRSGVALTLLRGIAIKTVIVECKQSRSDFLADSRDAERLIEERERLTRVRTVLEDQIVKICEPHLRKSGTRLFSELEEWDFSRSRVASYRAVLNDLRRIDERLHGESKFWTLSHYRLADWLYVAATPGVLNRREVPPGWGLVEIDEQGARIVVAAPEQVGKQEHRQRLLRNIAVAACRNGRLPTVPVEPVTLT